MFLVFFSLQILMNNSSFIDLRFIYLRWWESRLCLSGLGFWEDGKRRDAAEKHLSMRAAASEEGWMPSLLIRWGFPILFQLCMQPTKHWPGFQTPDQVSEMHQNKPEPQKLRPATHKTPQGFINPPECLSTQLNHPNPKQSYSDFI